MEKEKFINKIAPLIVKYAKIYGYKFPSSIIAQACLESGFGTTETAQVFNFFGMKCGSTWKGKSINIATSEEYTEGVRTNIRDNFRAYDTFEEGVEGYFKFLNWSNYRNLKEATSPLDYLQKIKADGYCTGSKYVDNVYRVLKENNLERFDKMNESLPILTKGSTGKEVTLFESAMKVLGYYNSSIDKHFGNGCAEALAKLQEEFIECGTNGKYDGKCGKKTWNKIFDLLKARC